MARAMKPVRCKHVRESLGLKRSQVAREAGMQNGTITWIEEGRFIPYESQMNKITKVMMDHGWTGDPAELFEESR